MTQTMMTGAQQSKAVMHMPVENKIKPLITATKQFICNHGSFNYAFFSTSFQVKIEFTKTPKCAELFLPGVVVANRSGPFQIVVI